ncbi:MAG: Verru_Chthon cassette protein A, partial [Chthoniobacteraceae bacterium]|nr:Verru_Chthon cassette protein A [Chthoniobacteraceae bacterium]
MTSRLSPPFVQSRRRGVALILVLGTLVFVSMLIVAFFGSVSHELASSKSYASGASSRIYADAAVNLVIGQLQAGTTQDDSTKTWTSQPGLIRRFNDQGRQENAFKLYSSNKMVEDGNFSPLTAAGTPSDVPNWTAGSDTASLPWNLYPNVYTDLNSPLVVTSGSVSLPKYPILNPGALAAAVKIEGFDVDASRALANSLSMNKSAAPGTIDQIPMPVRWIYILTDGRIATADTNAPDPAAVTLTTADGQPVAADNPPVARVAYWTDDDTCRLNINTASEGSYWNIPVAIAADDSLAANQVNAKEYQRYPGHPAVTSLSPVMNFLTTGGSAAASGTASYGDLRNFIFALTPRISGRGSQFGSRVTGFTLPVTPDADRLYASVDEWLFLPNLNTSDSERYPATTQNIQALKSPELDWIYTGGDKSTVGKAYTFTTNFGLDPLALEEARFFLTTNSRAPEVNLFGQPRLSLWPIDTRADHQSIYDRLLSFSSTVSGNPFYFQRQNPNSQTDDYDKIQRNQDLWAYLDRLTSSNIPGFGGNFSSASKYGTNDRQELVTSIFDWIRTVNLAYRDKAGAVQPYDWTVNPGAVGTQKPPAAPGSGQVLPIKIKTTQGYGRFPVLSKAAFAIIREGEQKDVPAAGKTTVTYRVALLMETYVPVVGYAAYVPDYHIGVTGLANGFELLTSNTSAATS